MILFQKVVEGVMFDCILQKKDTGCAQTIRPLRPPRTMQLALQVVLHACLVLLAFHKAHGFLNRHSPRIATSCIRQLEQQTDDGATQEVNAIIDSTSFPTATASITAADVQDSDQSSTCPFSKAFPRYRIDLTYRKQVAPTWKDNMFSPFSGLSDALIKAKLQKRYPKNTMMYEDDIEDGAPAVTYLWTRLATILSSDSSAEDIVYMPNVSTRLVQNWVEIVQWMQQQSDIQIPGLEVTLLRDGTDSNDDSKMLPAVRIQMCSTDESTISPPTSTSTTDLLHSGLEASTRSWVKRILVEQGICPFTKSATKSGQGLSDVGVPVGRIAYHSTMSASIVQLQADTWTAIQQMLEAGPGGKDGISSILMAAPAWDEDFDQWAGPIFCMLESSVVAAGAQDKVGVVCFHPQYATPDGSSWPGFGHMHSVPRLEKWHREATMAAAAAAANMADDEEMEQNEEDEEMAPTAVVEKECPTLLTTEEIAAGGAWQRRTPHATINVLRADQLEAAESRRTTRTMYATNIDKLVGRENGIGSNKLADDLRREQSLAKTQP